jgi:hypothetical protein
MLSCSEDCPLIGCFSLVEFNQYSVISHFRLTISDKVCTCSVGLSACMMCKGEAGFKGIFIINKLIVCISRMTLSYSMTVIKNMTMHIHILCLPTIFFFGTTQSFSSRK